MSERTGSSRQVAVTAFSLAFGVLAAWITFRWWLVGRIPENWPRWSTWITDVEVHSLRARWGWDLAFLFCLLSALLTTPFWRGRPFRGSSFGSATLSALLVAASALVVILLPALIVGGWLNSIFPFDRVDHWKLVSLLPALILSGWVVGLVFLAWRNRRVANHLAGGSARSG